MPVISIEFTIFVLISFSRIDLNFSRPFDEFFVLDLREHLGNESVERGQYQLRAARWSTRMPIVGSSPQISVWPLVPRLIPIVRSLGVRFLPCLLRLASANSSVAIFLSTLI